MDQELFARLSALPRLDPSQAGKERTTCRICGGNAPIFDAVDFWKRPKGFPFGRSGVTIPYFRCVECGYLFATFCDGWSPAEFAAAIYNDDYRKVDADYERARPTRLAEQMGRLLGPYKSSRILDYGAGRGVMGGLMNEAGFNVTSYDPFSQPTRPEGRFDLVTCFEVVEHAPDTVALFRDIGSYLADGGCGVLSQQLQPDDIADRRCNWWYVSPRNGHISLHTEQSLSLAARAAGLEFRRGAMAMHCLVKPDTRFTAIAERLARKPAASA